MAQGVDDAGVQVCSPSNVNLWDSNNESNAVVTNVVFSLHDGGILVKDWILTNPSWNTNDINRNCIPDDIELKYPDTLVYAGDTVVNDYLLLPYSDILPIDSYEGLTNIVISGTGAKGQGDIVPSVQIFPQHYVVTRGNPYIIFPAESYIIYDPSYGKRYEGVKAINQLATDSLSGFYQLWNETYLEVMPNDANCPVRVDLTPQENYHVF